VNTVYNTAFGDRNTLNNLVDYQEVFIEIRSGNSKVSIEYGPNRAGDIPHSLASIDKAKQLLGLRTEVFFARWIRRSGRLVLEEPSLMLG
jgi:UDP-glucose 4-epimerase